jgi:hypothetical protein
MRPQSGQEGLPLLYREILRNQLERDVTSWARV